MVLFLIVVVAIWAFGIAVWVMSQKWLKPSSSNKFRERLNSGTGPVKETGPVALFEGEIQASGTLLPRLMKLLDLTATVRSLIDQAGLKWNPVRFVQACLGSFLLCYGLAYYMLPRTLTRFSVVVAAGGAALPVVHLLRIRSKRLHAFESSFPDVLEFISRSMRAGHAFSVSLDMVHREFADPIAAEFRRTFDEHNLGLPLDVALQGLQARIPLLDVGFFVSAVMLQKRTGGNLAEILDKLAYVIRERFKLRGRIRAVSAHGRMTGIALTSIPVGVALLMFFTNPAYIQFFFDDDLGNKMMAGAVVLQVIGYLVIRKIVAIEV